MTMSDAFARSGAALTLVFSFTLGAGVSWAQGVLGLSPENSTPVYSAVGMAPKVLLTLSRDHTLAYAAYNDFSDIDGDGVLDYRFKPSFEYLGLFNSYYCYSYAVTGGKGLYSPASGPHTAKDASGKTVPGPCVTTGTSLTWSGNFLNYVTTSRIDALRVALYGGYREVDSATVGATTGQTILRRAYIPQDGHAWAKEYTSTAIDGYDISRYAPLAQPTANTRHFLGNLTSTVQDGTFNSGYPDVGLSCATLDDCSNKPPLLRIVLNSPNRVWQWASSQRPVLDAIANPVSWFGAKTSYGSGTLTDYHVRVEVCKPTFISGCKAYGSTYKPVGVLQDFGDNGSIDFGLLSGSYDNNMSGGRLRKNIEAFNNNEVNLANGRFLRPTYSIIDQIDKIRIRNFNNNNRAQTEYRYYDDNFLYKNYQNQVNGMMDEGTYGDWGSPIAEMMYEGLRYLSNQSGATPAYTAAGSADDGAVGLTAPPWVPPYKSTNWCAKPNQYVIASVNPSFDSDQLPGSTFGSLATPLTDLAGTAINAQTLTNVVGTTEGLASMNVFIGETLTNADGSPTAKTIANLGSIRGLMPDDSNKQGSYYAAAVAHFGKKGNLLEIDGKPVPSVDTFALMLNSPVPRITVQFGAKGNISIMPFARTVAHKNAYTDTILPFAAINQYVGVFVEDLKDPTNKSKQFYIKFRINFEDASWGSDHEMDALVIYEIAATNDGKLTVTVTNADEAGGKVQNIGYVVDGSTQDGPYLVVQDQAYNYAYPLNVPPGQQYGPGSCNPPNPPAACATIPSGTGTSSTRTFTPSATASTNIFLKDPLWYAAKWGGYPDGSPPTGPTTADPTNYAKVTSPASLKQAFANAFNAILQRANQASGVSASTQQLQTNTQVFTAEFNAKYFSGDLIARTINPNIGVTGIQFTQNWKASDTMPVPADRNMYFNNIVNNTGTLTALATGNVAAFLSANELNYVRGVRTQELQNGGIFRNRQPGLGGRSVLGSIVNSAPVYSDDTKTVYVAANDGMLHGFNAANGAEVFAYMPNAVTSYIANLADPNNARRNYLDGNIAISKKNRTGGVTYLAGFMGRAAKGVYGLAVDANGIKTGAMPWEFGATGDADMGYVLGLGLIEKLKTDGTDVLIFGNGYNSTNQLPVLYVVRLSDGVVLAKLAGNVPATQTSANGLATPAVTRNATNGRVEYAYAGDYLGQVWKFDLTDLQGTSRPATPTPKSGTLVFQTRDANDLYNQPITSPLAVAYSYDGTDQYVKNKTFVFVGTGSDLTVADAADATIPQSLYGIIDSGTYPVPNTRGNTNGDLVQRNFNNTTGTGTYTGYHGAGGIVYARAIPPSTTQTTDMQNRSGWVLDWPTTPTGTPKEKVVSAPVVRRSAIPTLAVSSMIPYFQDCNNKGTGWANFLDAYHGDGLVESYIDLNRDGKFSDETVGGAAISSVNFGIGIIGGGGFIGNQFLVQGSDDRDGGLGTSVGSTDGDGELKKLQLKSGRVAWRELVK